MSVTTKGRKRKGKEANMVEVNEGDQGKIIKMEDYERPQNLGALKKKDLWALRRAPLFSGKWCG